MGGALLPATDPGPSMPAFDLVALILLFAALIGCINQLYVGIPRSIALLVGSLAISLLVLGIDSATGYGLTGWLRDALSAADLPHIFLDGVLAFLLFNGSLHVSLRELRDNKWMILVLATASVIVATVLFAFGIWAVFQVVDVPVPLRWCAVLGAVLAPTDAVVVDSLLRRLALPPALRAAISGESLFNDGAGVILFLITLEIAGGQTGLIGHGRVIGALLVAGAGGIALGSAAGYLAARVMRRVGDYGLQLTISLALVIASYRLAGALDVSGPIAVVTAGLLLGQVAPQFTVSSGPESAVVAFWSLLDELLNAMLFLLIGFQVIEVTLSRLAWFPTLMAVPLAILCRFASVAIPSLFLGATGRDRERAIAVLTWAGLRGGVSVALALTLPPSPFREQLLTICYAVVVFTIVVQGLTMPRVIRGLYGPMSEAGIIPVANPSRET